LAEIAEPIRSRFSTAVAEWDAWNLSLDKPLPADPDERKRWLDGRPDRLAKGESMIPRLKALAAEWAKLHRRRSSTPRRSLTGPDSACPRPRPTRRESATACPPPLTC
jgi:hypothetical protein